MAEQVTMATRINLRNIFTAIMGDHVTCNQGYFFSVHLHYCKQTPIKFGPVQSFAEPSANLPHDLSFGVETRKLRHRHVVKGQMP